MYFGADFSPADNVESEIYALDFVNDLPAGDTISTASWTCLNAADTQVTDGSPASRIVGGSTISGTVVKGRFSAFVVGCKYILQATITTSQGNTLVGYSHVTGEAIS